MDQLIYDKTLKSISSEISKRSLFHDPAEVISDAYLKLSEQNIEISEQSLLSCCKSLIFKTPQFYVYRGKEQSKRVSKICSKCKEDFPHNHFYHYFKEGVFATQNYCIDCFKSYYKEYNQKNKARVVAQVSARRRKQREELHDTYIKHLLRQEGWKNDDITPRKIIERRQKCIENKGKVKKKNPPKKRDRSAYGKLYRERNKERLRQREKDRWAKEKQLKAA